jgi:hypothetical protein
MLKHSYACSSSESPGSPRSLFSLSSEDRLETTEAEELQVESSVDFERESQVPPEFYDFNIFAC